MKVARKIPLTQKILWESFVELITSLWKRPEQTRVLGTPWVWRVYFVPNKLLCFNFIFQIRAPDWFLALHMKQRGKIITALKNQLTSWPRRTSPSTSGWLTFPVNAIQEVIPQNQNEWSLRTDSNGWFSAWILVLSERCDHRCLGRKPIVNLCIRIYLRSDTIERFLPWHSKGDSAKPEWKSVSSLKFPIFKLCIRIQLR